MANSLKEFKAYLKTLQKSQQLQYIIEHLEEGVCLLDAQHIMVYVSPALAQDIHLVHDDSAGKSLREALAPYCRDDTLFTQIEAHTAFHAAPYSFTLADQSRMAMAMTNIPLYEEKNFLGSIVLFRNANDVARLQDDIASLRRELQQAGRHKSEFLANMSHELRTPLNAMIGYTSLTLNALKNTLPPDHRQNLINAEQAARVLLQMINDVLDFAKIEAGRIHPVVEEIDLLDLLDDVVMTTEGLLSGKTVEFQVELPKELPLIETDYTRVKQILDNLLSNAIKFTEKGFVALRTTLVTDKRLIHIEVEDTGSGIPEEYLENIFESFRQGDRSIKKRFGGTGLGLAITKRLCDMLNIQIALRSKINEGTLFLLDIPIRQISEKTTASGDARSTDDPRVRTQGTGPTPTATAPIKALVLCLTMPEMQEPLRRDLMELPLEVMTVKTAAECIELQHTRPIWTILVPADEMGLEAVRLLKSDGKSRLIPVMTCSPGHDPILFSANAPFAHEEKARVLSEMKLQTGHRPSGQRDNNLWLKAVSRSIRLLNAFSVVVIDDNRMNLDVMSSILKTEGYDVYTELSGKEGVNIIKSILPDFVITDLAMPEMDGFEVTQCLKREAATAGITVIACSAFNTKEYQAKALSVGCEGYITKPIEPEYFIEQVQKIVVASKIKKIPE